MQFPEFEQTVTRFEAHLHALRELERQTAEVCEQLRLSVPALLGVTQQLRQNASDLEAELREACGEEEVAEEGSARGGGSPQAEARLARAATGLERVLAVPHASAHDVVVEAERLHKCAHDEVYSRVSAARERFNGICCPLLTVLTVENVRRRIFAFIPGADQARKPRQPMSSAHSMRDLSRCRGVCRGFRRWLDSALTSVPRIVVAGGAMLGNNAHGKVGPQRVAEALDLVSLKWTALRPMRAKRCGAGSTVLADGRLLVAGGKSSEHLLLRSAEVYDPATNEWQAISDVSTQRKSTVAGDVVMSRASLIDLLVHTDVHPSLRLRDRPACGRPGACHRRARLERVFGDG